MTATRKTWIDADWKLKTDMRVRVVKHNDLWVKYVCPGCGHEQGWRNLFEPENRMFNRERVLETRHITACAECHLYFEVTLKFNEDMSYETEVYTLDGPVVAMA